jgi:subtilisin family serine protease
MLSPLWAHAQDNGADTLTHFYWASFTDKADSPYRIEQPDVFLSERAIERRSRLNIPVTEQDFPPNPEYLEGITAQGARIHHRSRWLNAATFYASSSLAQQIAELPYVDTVWVAGPYRSPTRISRARNFKMDSLRTSPRPEEPYGYGAQQIRMLNGDSLHQMGYRGAGTLIAVLDGGFTGVDQSPFFDSLRAAGRLMPSADIVDQDSLVWESSSHGTKVLSTMAANVPGVLLGTAPEASYVCVKTEDTRGEHRIEECHWVVGIEYADSLGADVVNSSLGYTTFDDPKMNYDSSSLTGRLSVASQAANIAAEKGLLVVTSAGNEGSSSWRLIGIPADAEKALSVGATDMRGNLASFSSVGPSADGRVKPDIVAPGAWVFTADAYQYRIAIGSGTSFAAPILAGLVACLRQAFPDQPVANIFDALRQSGSQAQSPDNASGYGLPDLVKAYELLKEGSKP